MAKNLRGAIVMDADDDLYDVVVVLFSTLSQVCSYQHYNHPTAINPHDPHDFLVVSELETIQHLQQYYQQVGETLPSIIHMVKPENSAVKYDSELAQLKIIPIRHAAMNDVAGTLQFDTFYQTIQEFRYGTGQG